MNACRIGDVLLLILMLAATEGCQTLGGNAAGQLTLRSEIDPATSLTAQFDVGQYQYRNKNELTVLLLDGPATDPTQAVVIACGGSQERHERRLTPTRQTQRFTM